MKPPKTRKIYMCEGYWESFGDKSPTKILCLVKDHRIAEFELKFVKWLKPKEKK